MNDDNKKNDVSEATPPAVNVKQLVSCNKCGNKPYLHNVFASGSYYKCSKCNLPRFQFPIPQTEGVAREQWKIFNS